MTEEMTGPWHIDYQAEWRALGVTLDTFNHIDALLARIIAAYIAPPDIRLEWVQKRLMHGSVIDYGAKLKLVLAIHREFKTQPAMNQDTFLRLNRIRNAIAHTFTASGRRRGQNVLAPPSDEPRGDYLVIESIKPNGELQETLREEAISEFNQLYLLAVDQLDALLKAVRFQAG